MLAAIIQNNQNVPRPSPIKGGWEGFRDVVDEGEACFVEVHATALDVEVYATFLIVTVVERGNLIDFIARFPGEPEEVHFVYTRPGENRPVADPGFGNHGSKIVQIDEEAFAYAFTIDTTGFKGGILEWHMWGTGENQRSAFGEIAIPKRKEQLL